MATNSAGVLLYRGDVEVLLGHMGGPFWARKDEGAWSIFKGEHEADEAPQAVAAREFQEETGAALPPGELLELGIVSYGRKRLVAFALRADFDAEHIVSNTFEVEWPPRSGRRQSFPEMDRAAWFDVDDARRKLVKGQVPLLDRLVERVGRNRDANG